MPFTVKDFQGLLRLLEQQPKWKDELRAVLLGEEFLELPRLVKELARAQRAASRQIRALTQAQQRAEERMTRLEEAVAALTEAQRRTEEQLAQLAGEVRALAEAQKRTEERVTRLEEAVAALAEAQKRTEQRVEELAEAQRRTEQRLAELATQVGRLSDTIGYSLEDLARDLTPDRLARRYGISVSVLERAYFQVEGQEVELDFYGVGQRDGQPVAIVGEAKSRIYGRDVEMLAERAKLLAPYLPAPPLPVLFGFVIHPSAREAADRVGAIVIASGGP